MEKRNVLGIKKIFATVVLGLMLTVGFLLVGCGNKYSAKFLKDEYVVSVGETVDITNDVKVKNISLQDLSFYSSDTSLLRIENVDSLQNKNKTVFTAMNSGTATLYIYFRNEVLSTAKVVIKRAFAIPTNISVSNTGVVTWNKVSLAVDGKEINAKYKLQISQDGINYQAVETDTNTYKLKAKGRYFIKIKAFGNEFVDDSRYSAEEEVYFQTVPTVTGLTLINNTEEATENARLSWNAVDGADHYVVNINDLEIDCYDNSYLLDTSAVSSDELLNVKVYGVSADPEIMKGYEASLKITKLNLTNVRVEENRILWDDVKNTQGFIVSYKSTDSLIEEFKFTYSNYYNLSNLPNGTYEVKVQAVGSTSANRSQVYASSQVVKLAGNLAKIENGELETSLVGNSLNMTIKTTSSEIKNFKIRIVEKETNRENVIHAQITGTASEGVYSVSKSTDILVPGLYEIYLTALSKGIEKVVGNGVECTNVVDSTEELAHSVYCVPTLQNITHSYDENFNSLITFSRPSFERLYGTSLEYKVRVNGIEVSDVQKSSSSAGYVLNIGKITKEYEDPTDPSKYIITIEADMNLVPDNSSRIVSVSEKVLTTAMFSLNKQGDGEKLEGKELTTDYTYSALNAKGYEYYILKTSKNELAEDFNDATKFIDNYGRILKQEPGYYSIQIIAYSNNPNLYLNNYEYDYFYVTKELNSPSLDFGVTDVKLENSQEELDDDLLSGYYVEINTVEDGKTYDVFLDDVKVGTVSDEDEDGKVYYYFEKTNDFSSGSYEIKVVANGEDAFIYHSSENSISVDKMTAPTSAEASEQNLKIEIEDGELVFYKDTVSEEAKLDVTYEQDGNKKIYNVDTSNFFGSFEILVKASKDNTLNEAYFIDSNIASFKVQKIATPSGLKFEDDKLYFEYNEENIAINDDKISLIGSIVLKGGSVEAKSFEMELPYSILTKTEDKENEYSFILNDVIDALREDYEEFDNAFSQRDTIEFTLYAETSYYDDENNIYMFSSKNAISAEDTSKQYIVISKLASRTIAFVESEKAVVWSDEENAQYIINIDDEESAQTPYYKDGQFVLDMSSYFNNIRNYEGKTITVQIQKIASNHINSNWSNLVELTFMKSVASLNIFTNSNGSTYARFTYTGLNKELSEITVNDKDIELTDNENIYQFALDSAVSTYQVHVKGYSTTNTDDNGKVTTTYYVSSNSDIFVLRPVSTNYTPKEIVFAENVMKWDAYLGDMLPNYRVQVLKEDVEYANVLTTETELSLSNETLFKLAENQYEVEIYAVNKDFTIYGGETKYYGGTVIAEGQLSKLNIVDDIELVIDDTKTTILEEQALKHILKWSWNGTHNQGANIKFEVYLNTSTLLATVNYVEGTTDYQVEILNSEYGDLENKISIYVKGDKDVDSNEITKSIYRFIAPEISITDEKILSITSSNAQQETNGYIVRIAVGGNVVERVVKQQEIDITDLVKDYAGSYIIDVLTKSISNVAVSPRNITMISGTLLSKPVVVKDNEKLSISSADADVNYFLTIYKEGFEIEKDILIENGVYYFDESLGNGNYSFIVIAKKEGHLTSYPTTLEARFDRVGEVTSLTLTRTAPTQYNQNTEYTFTWNAVSNALKYEFTIYTPSKQALLREFLDENSYSFDPALFLNFPGVEEYIVGVKAIAGNTGVNGFEKTAALNVKTNITNIDINDGLINFRGKGDYLLIAKDSTKTEEIKLSQDQAISLSSGNYLYEAYFEELSGIISVSIISVATDTNVQENVEEFVVDSIVFTTTVEKMQEISNIDIDEVNGKIFITTIEDNGNNVTIFFKSENAIFGFNPTVDQKNGKTYSEDFIKIFDKLEIESEGEISLEAYIVKSGKLKSKTYSFTFELTSREEGDYTQNRGIDFLHDYILIHNKENNEIKNIYIKLTQEEETLTIKEAQECRGYWNVAGTKAYFSNVADPAADSSEEVYAIKVNDLLTTSNRNYTIQVSYSYISEEGKFGINNWSEILDYYKLPVTDDIQAKDGKLYWSVSDINENITGYYVIFEEESGEYQFIYVPSSDVKEVSTESIFGYNKTFTVSVVTVNKDSTSIVASNKIYFRNEGSIVYNVIKSNEMAKALEIKDGVLSMTLDRDGSDESYGKLSTFTLTTDDAFTEDPNETDKIYMPYKLGRKSATENITRGTGTFTAIRYNNTEMYVRTALIDAGTLKPTEEIKVYESYNVAIEDVLEDNASAISTRYASSREYVLAFANTTFTYPFVFNVQSLVNSLNNFELTFKHTETLKENSIKVNALEILSRTKYAEIIKTLYGKNTTVDGLTNVKTLVELLANSEYFAGVASNEILFDEMGDKGSENSGESIQFGNYDIYVSQIGFGFTSETVPTFVLTSPKVKVKEGVDVCASVTTKTMIRTNADGYTNTYYIKFAPSKDHGEIITDYVLRIDFLDEKEKRQLESFNIKYEEVEGNFVWSLYIDDMNKITLETEHEGLVDYVLIALNGSNGFDRIAELNKNQIYNINIYSVGTETRLSSKTEKIEIRYLGFDSSINLSSNGFGWKSYNDGTYLYGSRVVYKSSVNQRIEFKTYPASSETNYFLPVESGSGNYEFIMFYTMGNCDKYSVVVDSEIYRVENIYQLYSPSVSVDKYNHFDIQNNAAHSGVYDDPKYILTNKKSPIEEYTTLNKFKPTENQADEFYFRTKGDEVNSFTIEDFNNGQYKLMKFNEDDTLFLTSMPTIVKGIMLKDSAFIRISEEGNVEWAKVKLSSFKGFSAEYLDDYTVAYRVVVEYYYQTADGSTKDAKVDTFYTSENTLPSIYLEGSDEENTNYVYKVNVYAFVCKDSIIRKGILTSLGEYGKENIKYADSDEYMVLESAGLSAEFTRLNSVTEVKVDNGKLTWKSEYRGDEYAFVVRAKVPGSTAEAGVVTGTYNYDGEKFVFEMDQTEDNKKVVKSGNEYIFSVYVYCTDTSKNKIESFKTNIEDVRILPQVQKSHAKITNEFRDGIQVDKIDVSQYFDEYNNTSYSKDVRAVFRKYDKLDDRLIESGTIGLYYSKSFEIYAKSGTYNSNENAYALYLTEGQRLEIDIYAHETANSGLYIDSFYYMLNLERTDWGIKDEVKFDSEKQIFTWTYGKEIIYTTNKEAKTYTGTSGTTESPIGPISEGTKVSFVNGYNSSNGYTLIWVDKDGDKRVDTGERAYIKSEDLDSQETEEKNVNVYFNVEITYVVKRGSSVQTDEYTYIRLYENVTNKYFIPEIVDSTITKFRVQFKEEGNDIYSEWKEYDMEKNNPNGILFDLFYSGDGSEANPYVIKNETQFRIMSLFGTKPDYLKKYSLTYSTRLLVNGNVMSSYGPIYTDETNSDKYYFKLKNDITLNQTEDFVIEEFDSVLDGNGFTITVNSQGGKEVSGLSGRLMTEDGYEDVSFNKASAIFYKLSNNAEIKNLKLNVNYSYVREDVESMIVSSLATINYGIIENVELTSFNFENVALVPNYLVVGGIVGVNKGQIKNVKIKADMEIQNQDVSQQMIYLSGVAAFNDGETALISQCVVESAFFTIKINKSANGKAQGASIALSNVGGQIVLCGNEADITVQCGAGKAFASGIVIYSEGGKIIDCYNNGEITNPNSAGIAYYCYSDIGNLCSFGNVNGVDNSVNTIAKNFGGNLLSDCYAKNNLSANVPTLKLSENTTLTTSDANINIYVTVENGDCKASFVYVN